MNGSLGVPSNCVKAVQSSTLLLPKSQSDDGSCAKQDTVESSTKERTTLRLATRMEKSPQRSRFSVPSGRPVYILSTGCVRRRPPFHEPEDPMLTQM